jgi:hypothetical protein
MMNSYIKIKTVIIICFIMGTIVSTHSYLPRVKADVIMYLEDAESYNDDQEAPDGWFISDHNCDSGNVNIRAEADGEVTPFGDLMLEVYGSYDSMGGIPAWVVASNTVNLPYDEYRITVQVAAKYNLNSENYAIVLVDDFELINSGAQGYWSEETAYYTGSITQLQLKMYEDHAYGGSGSAWFDNIKIEKINEPPVAEINGPYDGNVNEEILLDGTSSIDSDGTIISYEWDLDNDGQFDDAAGEQTSWSWSDGGEHPVSLQVTNDDTETNTYPTTMTIT